MAAAVKVAHEIEREAQEAGLSASCALGPGQAEARSVAVAIGGEGSLAFSTAWEGTVQWTERYSREFREVLWSM